MSQNVAIMDIGSYTITVMVVSRGVNRTISIKGKSVVEYEGYFDGKWVNPAALKDRIATAINSAQASSQMRISQLYIGVPGDFCKVVCNEPSITFKKRRKVTDLDVEALKQQGNSFRFDGYVLINNPAVYFYLDNGRKLIDPEGMLSTRLDGKISYIFASNYFVDTLNEVFASWDIEQPEYVSSVLAESLFLFDADERDNFALLADIGTLTTNVALIRGDGILEHSTINIGSSLLESELIETFNISSFEKLNAFKRWIIPTLDCDDRETSRFTFDGKTDNINIYDACSIVNGHFKLIGEQIANAVSEFKEPFPIHLYLYVTGEGIHMFNRIDHAITKGFGREAITIRGKLPMLDTPATSKLFGLADIVLDAQPMADGLLSRIKRRFQKD